MRWRAQAGCGATAAAETLSGDAMSDISRLISRKPPALTVTHSSETRSELDASSTGQDSPGRRRRASIDRPGQVSRRSNAPDAETNALLRDRFLHHLVTQVKLSSVVRAPCCAICARTACVADPLTLASPDAVPAAFAFCRHAHPLRCALEPQRARACSGDSTD